MGNNNQIDRQTLIKYLKGELSPEEAWKVERAMQEDPFLEEAMDGLEIAMKGGELTDDLEELDRRINIRDGRSGKPTYPLFIRVAAIFLILAVSVFTVIEVIHRNADQRSEMAMQKAKVNTDTAKSGSYNDAGQKETGKSEKVFPSSAQTGAAQPTPASPKLSKGNASSISMTKTKGNEPKKDEENMSEPLASSSNTREELIPAKENSDSGISMKIVPQEPAEKSELAVSRDGAGGIERNAKSMEPDRIAAGKNAISASGLSLSASTVKSHPVMSDTLYRENLISRLRYPPLAKQNGTEGDVIIQFIVNPDSTLHDFSILKGLGNGCDEEAIRVIREGPGWVPALENGKPVYSKEIYKNPFHLKNNSQ